MAQIVEKIDWSKNATSVRLKVKSGGFLEAATYYFMSVTSPLSGIDIIEVVNQVFLNKKFWIENKKKPGAYIVNITYGQSRVYISPATKNDNLIEWATEASKKGAANAKISRDAKKAKASAQNNPVVEPLKTEGNEPK